MFVKALLTLAFLSFSCAQISINGSNGRNYTVQGQPFGINCTVPASLDTAIIILKGLENVCSLLTVSCPIQQTEKLPCGCSIDISGNKIFYHMTDNATVEGFDDVWKCKEFDSNENVASVDITVYSGPDNIRLNSSSRVTVSNNQPVQAVQCSADCNPPCSYSWYTRSSDATPIRYNHRILPAEIITQQVPGSQVYTCEAINHRKPSVWKQTIALEIIVEPLSKWISTTPKKNSRVQMRDEASTDSSLSRAPSLTNTTRLAWITGITAKPTPNLESVTLNLTTLDLSIPRPTSSLRPTSTQRTTTTNPTTPSPTTTSVSSSTISTTIETILQSSSDTGNVAVVVGVVLGVVFGLIGLAVVAVVVILVIYNRGKRQARISRTISNAPGNPIYVNNPRPPGVNPNPPGALVIRNDEYMNYSQDGRDQYRIRSPTYVNTSPPPLYSSLDKQQLQIQPSNTYEPLGESVTFNPQFNLYEQLNNEQKGQAEAQSPLYMNTGSGSMLGINNDSAPSTHIDSPQEPVSLEYMNLNVAQNNMSRDRYPFSYPRIEEKGMREEV